MSRVESFCLTFVLFTLHIFSYRALKTPKSQHYIQFLFALRYSSWHQNLFRHLIFVWSKQLQVTTKYFQSSLTRVIWKTYEISKFCSLCSLETEIEINRDWSPENVNSFPHSRRDFTELWACRNDFDFHTWLVMAKPFLLFDPRYLFVLAIFWLNRHITFYFQVMASHCFLFTRSTLQLLIHY